MPTKKTKNNANPADPDTFDELFRITDRSRFYTSDEMRAAVGSYYIEDFAKSLTEDQQKNSNIKNSIDKIKELSNKLVGFYPIKKPKMIMHDFRLTGQNYSKDENEKLATQGAKDIQNNIKFLNVGESLGMSANLGNGHWISILIEKTSNGVLQAKYADSSAADDQNQVEINPQATLLFKNIGINSNNIKNVSTHQQHENDCGPASTQNLFYMANDQKLMQLNNIAQRDNYWQKIRETYNEIGKEYKTLSKELGLMDYVPFITLKLNASNAPEFYADKEIAQDLFDKINKLATFDKKKIIFDMLSDKAN